MIFFPPSMFVAVVFFAHRMQIIIDLHVLRKEEEEEEVERIDVKYRFRAFEADRRAHRHTFSTMPYTIDASFNCIVYSISFSTAFFLLLSLLSFSGARINQTTSL